MPASQSQCSLMLQTGSAVGTMCDQFGCTQTRQDLDTGQEEIVTGWEFRDQLSLQTGMATTTLVPIWGDYDPDDNLLAQGPPGQLPPGANGMMQAAKAATRQVTSSGPPQTSPGNWQPPQDAEDYLGWYQKAMKYILDNSTHQIHLE
jgi:hypothetical protein